MIQGANHAFHDVVDVGEIAAMVAVIENVDGLSGEYLLGEDKQRHIRPAPGTIDGEKPQAGGWQVV
jgi:hypothetical protein